MTKLAWRRTCPSRRRRRGRWGGGGADERLEPVGVGPLEAERVPEQPVVELARRVPQERPLVLGAGRQLRPDHHVELARREQLERAPVEVGVAEVDLVADDDPAAGDLDSAAEGAAVVGLALREEAHLRVLEVQVRGDDQRVVARPVLGQDDLVAEAQRLEPLAQVDHGGVQDGPARCRPGSRWRRRAGEPPPGRW